MKTDMHRFKKVIITDEDGKPMSWSEDQLCYCTNSDWRDDLFPVRIYTKQHANRLITKSKLFRKKNKFDVPKYKLMPVYDR